ncbi:lytic polysaccharide monooxygenase [Paenarthrobacter nicotinovorans]|uniref:Lytic polysaccharide monooxygenase n=1 Tax=Paenarthrobacter nicotinovorans TaxID=29320 RepID=A0ABV0GM02_PAENI
MKAFMKIGTCALLVGAIGLGGAAAANAHGYVGNEKSDVLSRALMPGNTNLGPVQYEPQSIEGPKGFTLDPATGGPADGKIASAGTSLAANLDQQSPDRWKENQAAIGSTIKIGWKYTAAHKTSEWRYYITKTGWDQNSPLTRAQLQPLATIKHDGSAAPQNTAHEIKLPAGHTGDHVIVAVWDIADTTNAFYNIIDLHISGDAQPEDPKPEEPQPEEPIGPDTIAPTAPTHVHSMGVTQNTVDLMWGDSSDNVGVDHYQIQRATSGGTFSPAGTTKDTSFRDTGLQADTTYSYRVIAVDAAGNKSQPSGIFSITTDKAPTNPENPGTPEEPTNPENPANPGTPAWNTTGTYAKGDIVTHNGNQYIAVQAHTGNGDPNWINALSLWKKI